MAFLKAESVKTDLEVKPLLSQKTKALADLLATSYHASVPEGHNALWVIAIPRDSAMT